MNNEFNVTIIFFFIVQLYDAYLTFLLSFTIIMRINISSYAKFTSNLYSIRFLLTIEFASFNVKKTTTRAKMKNEKVSNYMLCFSCLSRNIQFVNYITEQLH